MTRVLGFVLIIVTLDVMRCGAASGAGPGQPFGGNTTGCVPASREELTCSKHLVKALRTLGSALAKCHINQAVGRFNEAVRGRARNTDDGSCETAASGAFDSTVSQLSDASGCSGNIALSLVATEKATLLANQMNPLSFDARNGAIYCDSTLGVLISPSGDAAGFVPSTRNFLRCADHVAKNLSTLEAAIRTCHVQAADRGFRAADFDEPGCEGDAKTKYLTATVKLILKQICPPCLSASPQLTLGLNAISQLDATNGNAFPCSGTTANGSAR